MHRLFTLLAVLAVAGCFSGVGGVTESPAGSSEATDPDDETPSADAAGGASAEPGGDGAGEGGGGPGGDAGQGDDGGEGVGDQPPAPAPAPAACVPDLVFFEREVSLPVLEPICMGCHTATGAARASELVLHPPAVDGYLRHNFDLLQDIASYERDGTSVVLLKPTARVDHGGGLQIEVGSDEYRALEAMVRRFDAPVECDEPLNAELLDRLVLMDLPTTLRHAQLQLIGRLPDPQTVQLVAEGDEATFALVVRELLREDAFYDTLALWWNELLLTDKYLGGTSAIDLLDRTRFPNPLYWRNLPAGPAREAGAKHLNESVARAPLALIQWVVRHELPFTEVLTADYLVVNPMTAGAFGLSDVVFDDPADPAEFHQGWLDGAPTAGLLTDAMFLNRFPTTPTNLNRHRSRMTWLLFLATDVLKAGERPVDVTKVQDHNPTQNTPACAVCHAQVDPVAGAFQNWDELGRYRPPPGGWPEHLRPPGFAEEAVPADRWQSALPWLAERIAQDDRFALGAVRAVYQGLVGRAPVPNPTDPSDPLFEAKRAFFDLEQGFLHATAQVLRDHDFDLKVVIPEVLLSPMYRAVGARDLSAEEAEALAPLGTASVLWPERLQARLKALTGRRWRTAPGAVDPLLSSDAFRFYYGGIDSDTIVRRVTSANVLMSNIGLRMAAQLGCELPAIEFAKPAGDRLLLRFVQPEDLPEDEQGQPVRAVSDAVQRTLQHLHERLLGERLERGHPELQRSYALFIDTWREGRTALLNRQTTEALPAACQLLRDPETDEPLPAELQLVDDPHYTLRAWGAVITYLLADFRLLYE